MTCLKANQPGQQWNSAGFGVFVEASSGTTGCSDVERLTRQVTVNALPTVVVSAANTRTVCAAAGTVDIDFSVSATAAGTAVAWAVSGTPVASVEGVQCTAGTPTGECFRPSACSQTCSTVLPAAVTANVTKSAVHHTAMLARGHLDRGWK